MKTGKCIWLTGRPCSGKTTIAKKICENNPGWINIDGDEIRKTLNSDLGFTPEDRTENIRRTIFLTMFLSGKGIDCIVSVITPYRIQRKMVGANLPDAKIVYCKCSLQECERRDVKGFYAKARAGEIKNFTGLGDYYEEPEKPDMIIDTEAENLNESVEKIQSIIKNDFI